MKLSERIRQQRVDRVRAPWLQEIGLKVALLEEGLAEYLDMCLTYTVDFGALQAENAKARIDAILASSDGWNIMK